MGNTVHIKFLISPELHEKVKGYVKANNLNLSSYLRSSCEKLVEVKKAVEVGEEFKANVVKDGI